MRDEPGHHGFLNAISTIRNQNRRRVGHIIRTALQANNSFSNLRESLPLHIASCGLLEPDSSRLPTNPSHKALGQDPTPPCLNPDSRGPHLTVALHTHMPSHILLNHGDHSVKSIRT